LGKVWFKAYPAMQEVQLDEMQVAQFEEQLLHLFWE
jgi:hypothetical protein